MYNKDSFLAEISAPGPSDKMLSSGGTGQEWLPEVPMARLAG